MKVQSITWKAKVDDKEYGIEIEIELEEDADVEEAIALMVKNMTDTLEAIEKKNG